MTAPLIAYVIEPAFPGGTSAAVARELRTVVPAIAPHARIEVHAVTSRMFPGRPMAPVLADAIEDLGLNLHRDAPRIAADTVIVHNPSFLKFDATFAPRIVARDLILVTHENFLRPGGHESHDVAHCLDLFDRSAVALRRSLAPVSTHNRATLDAWCKARPGQRHWRLWPEDWINICDFPLLPPTRTPRDRRGRHSRPGFEKFPTPREMDLCFPRHAEANVILGADGLEDMARTRPHWRTLRFGEIPVDRFLQEIDFMVYFTARTFRESFGRVLAESIAAGKVVLTDPDTSAIFGDAVVATRPEEVDRTIADFLARPETYVAQVERAQAGLGRFSGAAFLRRQARVFGLAADPAVEAAA
jgi:hypothetical protein